FREDLHLYFERGVEHAGDVRAQDDQIADLDRVEELQVVDGGGHQQAARVAMTGDRAGDVDQMHHRAAEDEPERVRVVRQHDLDHLGRRIRGPLRRRSGGWGLGIRDWGDWWLVTAHRSPQSSPPTPESPSASEVVADPDCEPRLTPFVGAVDTLETRIDARAREHGIFPVVVQQGSPRPVEVNREPEGKGLEAEAVCRPAILPAEPRHAL